MRNLKRAGGLFAAVLLLATSAWAEPKPSDAEVKRLITIMKSQHPQWGDIAIPAADMTLHLGRDFYFLGPEEAKRVLIEWGNPPEQGEGVLGLVFPRGVTFADGDSWGAVITYDPAGYITDKDANAGYDEFLEEVRKGEDEENEARRKAGYPTSHLVGWAQPPTYDKVRHSVIWARDLEFGNQAEHMLNYDVRLLGRRGYVSLNLVAPMSLLPTVRTDATKLAATAAFNPGSAYADFKPGLDKKADYGVAGLVAAGLGLAAAKKFGLLAVIALFAKKFFVLMLAAGAAVWNWMRKLFGGKRKSARQLEPPSADAPPEDRDAA